MSLFSEGKVVDAFVGSYKSPTARQAELYTALLNNMNATVVNYQLPLLDEVDEYGTDPKVLKALKLIPDVTDDDDDDNGGISAGASLVRSLSNLNYNLLHPLSTLVNDRLKRIMGDDFNPSLADAFVAFDQR
jgi:hypothetical protein